MPGDAAYRTLRPMFDELRGARVLVRPYRPDDAAAVYEAIAESREHLRPWESFADAFQTVEETRDWINRQTARWLVREWFYSGLWQQGTGRYLGGLWLAPAADRPAGAFPPSSWPTGCGTRNWGAVTRRKGCTS